MIPYEQAKSVYQREPCVRTFEQDLALHMEFGYVYSTPRYFVMFRPVDRKAPQGLILDPSYTFPNVDCDCWHVYLAAGDLGAAWEVLPWKLEWMSFERKNILRFVKADRIRRLSA